MTKNMTDISKLFSRWKAVLLITLAVRALLFALAYLLNGHTLTDFFSIWVRWDGPHYLAIAEHWYQSQGEESLFIVFYPLYPLLIRIISVLGINFAASAILVSTFFSFTAAILLYELVRLDFNHKTALKSVWFLNIFPTALFLQASYTESLFLTLSLAAFLFYRINKPFISGLAGLLSSLTRINGILLLPALLFERKKLTDFLINVYLIPIGLFIYLLINYVTFGNPLYFTKPLASNWFKHLTWPWSGVAGAIHAVPTLHNPNFYIYFSEIVALAFIVFVLIPTFFTLRKSYSVYILANLLLFTSTSYILSTPRYILILFPVYILLARIKNKPLTVIISCLFIILLLISTYLYTSGRWVS